MKHRHTASFVFIPTLLAAAAAAAAWLLAAGPTLAADETAGHLLRYGDCVGALELDVRHDIHAGPQRVQVERTYRVVVGDGVLSQVRGSYTAHEMKQRLPLEHLVGLPLALSPAADRRSMRLAGADAEASENRDVELDTGGLSSRGVALGRLLDELMPVLPDDPVAAGTLWTTTRPLHVLDGWNHAVGTIEREHLVSVIETRDGRTVVTVTSSGRADLAADDPETAHGGGTLEEVATWSFDVDAGRLASVTVTRTSSGTNTLPQGQLPVRQTLQIAVRTRSDDGPGSGCG